MSRVLSAFIVALVLAGCSVGGASVSTDDLEQTISDRLTEQVGITPDEIDCPEPLPAEEGAQIRCGLIHEGETYGITVTATRVDGSQVDFDFQVDDEPQG